MNLLITNGWVKTAIIGISFVFCVTVNLLNLSYLEEEYKEDNLNGKSIIYNGTIYSIDNEWYLPPAINFISHGIYAHDLSNPLTKVRRTPGYPIFYGMHYYLFGERNAHAIIGFTQSALFAISALLLGLAVFNFTNNHKLSILTALLYCFCPYTAGYTFYTITESIHPAFTIFSFYFLSKVYAKKKLSDAFLTGVFFAAASLIRPSNILFGVPVLIVFISLFIKHHRLSIIKNGAVLGFGFLVVFLPWVIRNYQVSNEFIPLEKYYHNSPMGMGRSQIYLSKWWMCFDNPEPVKIVTGMINSYRSGSETGEYAYIDNFLNDLPPYAFSGSSRQEVREALMCVQDCYKDKEYRYGSPIKMLTTQDSEIACEFECQEKLERLVYNFKKDNPIRYYIIAPYFTRGKEFVLHSFSSMYGSLNPDDKNFSIAQKVCKGFMYLINLSLFLAFAVCLFITAYKDLRWVCLTYIGSTFIVLVHMFHIEARYLISAYPFLYILLAICLLEGYNRVKPHFKRLA